MKVGICAIIKDCEPRYIKEWLDWHFLIGVDYFFIYDNESSISIKETVKEYENVFVTDIKGKIQQCNAYNDCIKRQKKRTFPKCDWIAFIDDDEFLVFEKHLTIKNFLTGRKVCGIVLNWSVFGASDEVNLSQIERYKKCVPAKHMLNRYVKTIVQPLSVDYFHDPHFPVYLSKHCYSVDIKNRIIEGSVTEYPMREEAWINHYYCKNLNEFNKKIERGRATRLEHHKIMFYHRANSRAIEHTETILQIKNKLKNERNTTT